MKQIIFFQINGKSPFLEWLLNLDRLSIARVRAVLSRMEAGHMGDWKFIAPGLKEMRLFFGGGYRIYYTEQAGKLIILLCAGDKKTQSKDIAKAKKYLAALGAENDQKK